KALQGVFIGLRLQALVFTEGHPVREDGVNTVVHISFVINLVRNQIDGLQLVGVTRREDDLLWVVLAVALNFREHLNIGEVNFVKNYNVVSAVVKFADLLGGVVRHAYAKKRVQRHAVF
ncbi:MAG: hypothetical protein ACK56F_12235, partial [bacterium]